MAFTIDIIMADSCDNQNIYSWISYSVFRFFMTNLHQGHNLFSLVKDDIEQGIHGSLHNLEKEGIYTVTMRIGMIMACPYNDCSQIILWHISGSAW